MIHENVDSNSIGSEGTPSVRRNRLKDDANKDNKSKN